jgi:hypothetical protein
MNEAALDDPGRQLSTSSKIGPAAANLGGARDAAERVANRLSDLWEGGSEFEETSYLG